jgi:hypothetical protein
MKKIEETKELLKSELRDSVLKLGKRYHLNTMLVALDTHWDKDMLERDSDSIYNLYTIYDKSLTEPFGVIDFKTSCFFEVENNYLVNHQIGSAIAIADSPTEVRVIAEELQKINIADFKK